MPKRTGHVNHSTTYKNLQIVVFNYFVIFNVMKTTTLVILAYFVCFIPLHAQTIVADRIVDWSNAGVEGGIPTICNESAIAPLASW